MPGPLPKYPIQLTPEQEVQLHHLSPCYTAPFADGLCRNFCSGGHEGAVAPVWMGMTRPSPPC